MTLNRYEELKTEQQRLESGNVGIEKGNAV